MNTDNVLQSASSTAEPSMPDRDVPAEPPMNNSPCSEEKSSQRWTTLRLLLIFIAVLAGSIGGKFIADSLMDSHGGSNDAMTQWMSNYGGNYLAISRDANTVNADFLAQNPDLATARADCSSLGGDVRIGQAAPPMPEKSLAPAWFSILAQLSDAAQSCVAGIDRHSEVLLTRTQTDFTNAEAQYLHLVKLVQKLR